MKHNDSSQSGTGADLFQSPDYETKQQLADRLAVSVRCVDDLMRSRRIPFLKISGKLVRFKRAEVDAFLAEQFRVKAAGE